MSLLKDQRRTARWWRPWSGRRREELKGNSVRVAEGDPGAVVGVLDPAVPDAELVQARDPRPQLVTVAAGERNMIKASAMLVESVTCGPGMGMQAKQLPSAEREHGVVKAPGLLVLVQDRPGTQQLAVPAGAPVKVSHGHGDMGDRRELRHSGLLIGGARLAVTEILRRLWETGVSSVQTLMPVPPAGPASISELADFGGAGNHGQFGEPAQHEPVAVAPVKRGGGDGEAEFGEAAE